MAAKREEVSPEQMELSFSGAALAVNKFFITVGPNGVRLAFAEGQENVKFFFRTAVLIPFEDAIALKDILGEMVAPIEAAVAAQKVQSEENA